MWVKPIDERKALYLDDKVLSCGILVVADHCEFSVYHYPRTEEGLKLARETFLELANINNDEHSTPCRATPEELLEMWGERSYTDEFGYYLDYYELDGAPWDGNGEVVTIILEDIDATPYYYHLQSYSLADADHALSKFRMIIQTEMLHTLYEADDLPKSDKLKTQERITEYTDVCVANRHCNPTENIDVVLIGMGEIKKDYGYDDSDYVLFDMSSNEL